MRKKNTTPSSPIKRTHVMKSGSGWAVRQDRAQRATRIYETKEQAIEHAKKFLTYGNDVVIHENDGSVQEWMTPSGAGQEWNTLK